MSFEEYEYMVPTKANTQAKFEKKLMQSKVFFYDAKMAIANKKYGVCSQLANMTSELKVEMSQSKHHKGALSRKGDYLEDKYSKMVSDGELQCAQTRVGDGILRAIQYREWDDCISGLLEAKERLLGYVKELCDTQVCM